MDDLQKIKRRAFLAVLGSFLIVTGSGFAGSLSLFYLPVTRELGVSKTALAVYVSTMSMCGIITQPLVGRLLTKHGNWVRWIVLFGAVCAISSFGALSRAGHLYQFYLVGAFMSIMLPIMGALMGSTIITNWFEKKRSLAISIVLMGSNTGEILCTQVARYFIDNHGWRAGYVALGSAIFAVVFVGALLISAPPAVYELQPYGAERTDNAGAPSALAIKGFTLAQALRTPGFWLTALAAACGSIYIMGIMQSLVPMVQVDYGFTAVFGTTMLAVYNVTGIVAKPVMGMCYDRIGTKRIIMISGLFTVFACLILCSTGKFVFLVLSMVCLGIGNILGSVILNAFTADAFGNREFSSIIGFINIAFTLGCAVGPIVTGRSVDLFNSYRPAYALFAVLALSAAALLLCARRSLKYSCKKLGIEL